MAPTPDRKPGSVNRGIPLPLIHWRGFTPQMFLFIVLPLTVLLLVIVVISQSLHHDAMRSLVGDRDLRAVRASANNLSDEIEHRATAMEALSFQGGSLQASPSLLDQAAQNYGFDGGLAIFDRQGKRLAQSAGAAPEILDMQHISSAVLIKVGPGIAQNPSAAQFSPPVQSADGRWLLLGLAYPQGDTLLAGAFSPTSLAREALAGVVDSQNAVMLLAPGGEVLFSSGSMNHTGPVTRYPGAADVLRGESGVNYISAGSGGMVGGHSGEQVIAFSPVPPFGWGLVIEEPWEESAGPLLNLTQSAPLILAPVLILALLALWFGARQIIQPIQALENRAGQLAAGNFSAIRVPVGGIDEIQNLQNELIEMAAALQKAQEALHAYIGALTAGLETERRSLARELHDDTLQALIALNQHVQLTILHTSDPQQRQSLLELQGRVTETIANLRRAIGGLRPIYLEDLGLVAALGMLARSDGSGPEVDFRVTGAERRLAPETELAFYRIAQEALNNAVHHAQAKQIQIELSFDGKATRLSVSDNGRGFNLPGDPGAFAHLGHYGLLGMHERADLAGAEIKIESAVGQGTRVTVCQGFD